MTLLFPLKYRVIGVAGVLLLLLGVAFLRDRRKVFLPGRTSDGHHLVEAACNSCHVAFAGVPNEKCVACHRAELAEDTHNVRMFDDPRWAGTLEKIDALTCVTCHGEHRVLPGGVTVPREFCFPCHDDVVQKRENHRTLKADSCGNAGCHNYHDNTGLNTAFLKRHFGEPDMRAAQRLPEWGSPMPAEFAVLSPIYPGSLQVRREIVTAWQGSIHARKEANCLDCHKSPSGDFLSSPGETACERCHQFEVATFHAGKHGVRPAIRLAPLRPEDARLPMKAAADRSLRRHGCATCHDPHSVDTRRAAVESCLACHDDAHSLAFKHSKHFATFARDEGGPRVAPEAVTCATCHLPRGKIETDEGTRVAVNHNNSFTLRPRERMVKEVCSACHGLEFAINSIFDDYLVENNFQGRPARRHETFTMIEAVVAEERGPTGGGR